jgi:chromosome partitioning protein
MEEMHMTSPDTTPPVTETTDGVTPSADRAATQPSGAGAGLAPRPALNGEVPGPAVVERPAVTPDVAVTGDAGGMPEGLVAADAAEAERVPRAILTPGINGSANGSPVATGGNPQPVDNDVDVHAESARSVRESDLPGLGDNAVDEGLDLAPVSRETLERDELAATIPTVGEDTPLARELADNTRRRIQLTGREFPKPLSPRILTVANQKGGVGKTTTTVNIAAAMAHAGLKVLVVDLDPQGNASTALGIDHHAEVPSIYDVLVDGTPLLDVVQPCTTVENLFCAPATIDLAGAEIELVSLVARESRLQKAIAAAEATGHAYDYILIDCPPSLGLLTVNAMVAASEVFIPIQCEYYALEGLSQLLKNIELIRAHLNPPLHVSTILLTMYDGRTRLSAQVADEVREHFPEQVLRTTVPRSVRVSEAPSFGETVMTYDPASSGALAYLEAAGEIADRGAGLGG